MKVLYVGVIHPGWVNTTWMRQRVLEELGHEIHPLCLSPFLRWGGRYGGAIFRRYQWGIPLALANRAILSAAKAFRPDLLWIDKGAWVTKATLRRVKKLCGAHLLHYTPDPFFLFHRSRHFVNAVPAYDALVTSKRYEAETYRSHGAQRLIVTKVAFDTEYHRPIELSRQERLEYGCEAVFIGSYGEGRERYLKPLVAERVSLSVWGENWTARCPDPEVLAAHRGRSLVGLDYAKGLAGAKIGLGLLSPLVPDRSTTRSVEIPACGVFLLAERTDEHQELFEEGEEAEFFDGSEELLDKVRYFLAHDSARERIAAAGRRRCLESGYSYRDQIAGIIEMLP